MAPALIAIIMTQKAVIGHSMAIQSSMINRSRMPSLERFHENVFREPVTVHEIADRDRSDQDERGRFENRVQQILTFPEHQHVGFHRADADQGKQDQPCHDPAHGVAPGEQTVCRLEGA